LRFISHFLGKCEIRDKFSRSTDQEFNQVNGSQGTEGNGTEAHGLR